MLSSNLKSSFVLSVPRLSGFLVSELTDPAKNSAVAQLETVASDQLMRQGVGATCPIRTSDTS